MTTVAFDGRILAADTLVTGFKKDAPFLKFFVAREGNMLTAIAGTGAAASFAPAVAWFLNDGDPKNYPNNDLRIFAIINEIGSNCPRSVLVESAGNRLLTPIPHAEGSGADVALGALLAGKNAIDAVKIAALHDPGTGPDVYAVDMVTGEWINEPSASAIDRQAYLLAPFLAPPRRARTTKRKRKTK